MVEISLEERTEEEDEDRRRTSWVGVHHLMAASGDAMTDTPLRHRSSDSAK